MAVSQTTNLTNTIDSINNQSKALEFAMPFLPYAMFGIGDAIAERRGNTIKWYRHAAVGEYTTTLAESPTWAPATHSVDSITATMALYGNGREITELLDKYSVFDLRPDLLQWAGEEAGRSINAVTRATLISSVTTKIFANGKATGTMTSGDTANLDLFLDAAKTLKKNDAPAFIMNGQQVYVAIISPDVEAQLLKTTAFRDAVRYGSSEKLFLGYLGIYGDVAFVRTSTTATATHNAIVCDQSFVMGQGAYGVPSMPLLGKSGVVPNGSGPTVGAEQLNTYNAQLSRMFRILVTEPGDGAGNGAHGDEWATRFKVAWKALWTCVILNQNFIVNAISAR